MVGYGRDMDGVSETYEVRGAYVEVCRGQIEGSKQVGGIFRVQGECMDEGWRLEQLLVGTWA